jgi:DNA-binding protein H-NS
MSCQLCLNEYDHSINKPYTLSCWLHTFCISCIGKLQQRKCPVCKKYFDQYHPNLALLELIPESNYDKLKAESFKILNELNELKNNLANKRDEKQEKYLREINEVKNTINKTANKLVKLVRDSQEKLINEANVIESNMKRKLWFNTRLDENQTKMNLEGNVYHEEQLSIIIKETTESKINLEKSSTMIVNFKENYKFNANKTFDLNESFVIGEIKTNKKVKNYFNNIFYCYLIFFFFSKVTC